MERTFWMYSESLHREIHGSVKAFAQTPSPYKMITCSTFHHTFSTTVITWLDERLLTRALQTLTAHDKAIPAEAIQPPDVGRSHYSSITVTWRLHLIPTQTLSWVIPSVSQHFISLADIMMLFFGPNYLSSLALCGLSFTNTVMNSFYFIITSWRSNIKCRC